MNSNRTIPAFCTMHIETLEDKLKSNAEIQIANIHLLPVTLNALRNIRENDSFKLQVRLRNTLNGPAAIFVRYSAPFSRQFKL